MSKFAILHCCGLASLWVLAGCDSVQPPPVALPPTMPVPVQPPAPNPIRKQARKSTEKEPLPHQTETARLKLEDGNERDYFGTAVAVHGNRLVVGAHGDDQAGKDFGAAFLYEFDHQGKCELVATFRAEGLKKHVRYGNAVALGADFVAVGASWKLPHCGAVYIYEPNADAKWEQSALLEVSGEGFADQMLGGRLAASGDLLLIGAEQHDKNRGAAFLFRRQQRGEWKQIATLVSDDVERHDQLGAAVAISVQTAVLGSRHNGKDTGSAYVFQPDAEGTWRQVAKLKSADPKSRQFGIAVAVAGETVVVGEWLHSGAARHAGAVHVFRPDEQQQWQPLQTITVDDAAENDQCGYSVAAHDNQLLLGMLRLANGSRLAGAYLYTSDNGGPYKLQAKLQASAAQPAGKFGSAISLTKEWALVGDESQQKQQGAAYLFRLP